MAEMTDIFLFLGEVKKPLWDLVAFIPRGEGGRVKHHLLLLWVGENNETQLPKTDTWYTPILEALKQSK